MAVSLAPMPPAIQGLDVSNPRTGEHLYTVPEATENEIRAAYVAARGVEARLRAMTVAERVAETSKLKKYILKHKEYICERIVSETGKTPTEAMLTEIFPTLDLIQYYEKHGRRILKDERHPTPLVLIGKKSRVYYEPLGTVLIISPWNYPFNLSMCPIITAIVAGNPVIFKPSEHTPLRGLVEEICQKSGFMKDAIQVIYGAREVGRLAIEERPAKVFFTGSDAAGRAIMAHCAQYLIPVELELGGKDPMIVFDDVNVNRAANGALWGSFVNSGQTCTSVERLYVQEGIYDKFLAVLREEVEHLKTPLKQTPACDPRDLDIGSMTAEFQVRKVEGQIEDAVAKGAGVVCGGKRAEGTRIIPPTILTNVTPDMKISTEETFGPVVTVTPFKTEAEVIALANDSPFGLSASVWTHDLKRAERVARAIVTGNVSINNVLATQGNAALPFGGVRASGMGRYKGAHGLYAFSNIKSIMIDRDSGIYEPIWYPYTAGKYNLVGKLLEHSFSGGVLGTVKSLVVGVRLLLLEHRRHY